MSSPETKHSAIVLRQDARSLEISTTIRGRELCLDSEQRISKGDRSYGGSGLPTPSEFFMISVGGCFGITMKTLINAWRIGESYLSDYVEDVEIDVSKEESRSEAGLSINRLSVHATVALRDVERKEAESFLTRLPGTVKKWCPVTGIAEKALPLKKTVTLIIRGERLEREF